MNESVIVKKIEETLLKIVSHEEKPEIIFMFIDTSTAGIKYEDSRPYINFVPYLNIYGHKIYKGNNLDNSMQIAIEKEDFGYVAGILKTITESDFEINLVSLYPNWPDETEVGDEKIITSVKNTINNSKEKFEHIKKLYFYYIDSFEFTKIIDKPA